MQGTLVKAGEKHLVLSKFSNSMAMNYSFTAEPINFGDDVTGTIEIKGSNWLFPKPAVTQALAENNTVSKTTWDTIYRVYVTPDIDVRIQRDGFSLGANMKVLILVAIAIGLIAVAMVFATTF